MKKLTYPNEYMEEEERKELEREFLLIALFLSKNLHKIPFKEGWSVARVKRELNIKFSNNIKTFVDRVQSTLESNTIKVLKRHQQFFKKRYGLETVIKEKDIIKHINRKFYGKHLKDRIWQYADRIPFEVFINNKNALNKELAEITFKNYRSFMKKPLENPNIIKQIQKGFLSKKDVTFPRGESRSALINLDRLSKDTLRDAKAFIARKTFEDNDVLKYRVKRGSGYDCVLCNPIGNKIYPISYWILPMHNRCMCYPEPIIES